jgi:hypothetical protein
MNVNRSDIPDWECRELIASEGVGRLCVIDGAYPLAFPVNYRAARRGSVDTFVFRTSPTTALARCVGPSSLEIDRIDDAGRNAWSIIVRGELRRIIGDHELPDPHPLITEGRYQWMVLDVAGISGRRFRSAPAADGFTVEWQPG